MTEIIGPRMAAIVCGEIANGAPILYAIRSECLRDADSGWQFLCGAVHESAEKFQVWAIHEVLDREESLKKIIDYPIGTVLTRASAESDWEVSFE